jgi:hypothetical protein
MKHRLLIAIGGVLLLSCVVAWFLTRRSVASPGYEFSPGDFARIRQVTRQRMLGTALPDFSPQTIMALPRWLRRFGSSRIRQIDVLPAGTVNVHVESSFGRYYYLAEKYEKSGRWDWRIVREGMWPQGAFVINSKGAPDIPRFGSTEDLRYSEAGFLLSLLRTGFRRSPGEGSRPQGTGRWCKAQCRLLVRIRSGSPLNRKRSPGRIHRAPPSLGGRFQRRLSPRLYQTPMA